MLLLDMYPCLGHGYRGAQVSSFQLAAGGEVYRAQNMFTVQEKVQLSSAEKEVTATFLLRDLDTAVFATLCRSTVPCAASPTVMKRRVVQTTSKATLDTPSGTAIAL